jgi:hypothetical protein
MTHATMDGDFVLLRAGALRLLLPLHEVGAARYLDSRPFPTPTPGLLQDAGGVCAALSDAMELLPECPPERFILAPLSQARPDIAWCWDHLRVLIGVRLDLVPLPTVLAGPSMPVHGYVELDGEPAFVTSAADVCRYSLPEGA